MLKAFLLMLLKEDLCFDPFDFDEYSVSFPSSPASSCCSDSIQLSTVKTRGAKFVRIQFGGWAVMARVASPNGPGVSAAKPRTTAHPVRLDSDKCGDEAAAAAEAAKFDSHKLKAPPPPTWLRH